MTSDQPAAPRGGTSTPHPHPRKRGIVLGMFAVPLLVWCVVAVTAGTRAPLVAIALACLPLPLLALPQVWPDLTRQRRSAAPVQSGRALVFDAPAADRWSYAVMALLFLAAPLLVHWDAARIGEQVPTQMRFWLWLAVPLGVAGVFWQARWRRTQISLDPALVSVQTSRGVVEIPWGQLADAPPNGGPRLEAMLAAGGGVIDGHSLRADPHRVADVIEFYRTHPSLRRELATGEATDRIDRGDVTSAPPSH